jgi:transcriptional regulator with XRE-family HTH domain
MTESENIGSRLRRLIDAAHDGSVNRAASMTGLSHVTLGRIVKGQVTNPRAEALSRIAAAYQTTIDWLLHGKGAEPEILSGAIVSDEAERLEAIESGDVARKPTPRAIEYLLMMARLELSNEASAVLRSLPTQVSHAVIALPFPISVSQVAILDEAREAAYEAWRKLFAAVIASVGQEAFREIVETNVATLRAYMPPDLTPEQFDVHDRFQRAVNQPRAKRARSNSKKRI